MTREELKRSIVADMERNEFLASLWSNVKRKYKKDGGTYSILSKNFEGCTIKRPDWGVYEDCEWLVQVSGHNAKGAYDYTHFSTYNGGKGMTADQIEVEIKKEAKIRRENAEEYKRALEKIDDVFDMCDQWIQEIEDVVRNDKDLESVKYKISDYIKELSWLLI